MENLARVTLTLTFLICDLGKVKGVRVDTPLGPVEGVASENSENFLGIKFATAERFGPPVPVSPWKEVLQASRVGPMCPQACPPLPPKICLPEMSEDCLYLNVFRPKRKPASPLPVMLFLHGGNFKTYSGGSPLFAGDFIAALADVIVVTVNYRLGALGWLAFVNVTGEVTAANFGLEDQRAAMLWVRDNIASFGGDPSKVTLWGQSAGCQSVGLHLVQPKSRGLFHRAILESCPLVLPFKSAQEARSQNAQVSLALSCSAGNVTCLRARTSQQIVDVTDNMTSSFSTNLLMKFQVWGPVVDSRDVTDRYLLQTLKRTTVTVPVILGTTADEADIFVMAAKSLPLNGILFRLMLYMLWPRQAGDLLELYPPQQDDAKPTMITLANDVMFKCPTTAIGKRQSDAGAAVWQYFFNQPLSFDGFGYAEGTCINKSCHGGDLPFLFATPPSNGFNVTLDDQLLSKLLIGYWGNFAHHGNPDGDVAGVTTWPDVSRRDENGRGLHFLFQSRNFGTIPEGRREYCEIADNLPLL